MKGQDRRRGRKQEELDNPKAASKECYHAKSTNFRNITLDFLLYHFHQESGSRDRGRHLSLKSMG